MIPFEGATEEDDAVTVRDIELDDNEGEAEEIRVGEQEKEEVSGAATPMSVDSEGEGAFKEKEEETAEAMRLRGGAGVSIEDEEEEETDDGLVVEAPEDEEEYDDDEIDEDEVELGLLAPMPETWDVDYAVGKVGGKPVWLDPRSPLDGGDVECGRCGRVMSMLLQVRPFLSFPSLTPERAEADEGSIPSRSTLPTTHDLTPPPAPSTSSSAAAKTVFPAAGRSKRCKSGERRWRVRMRFTRIRRRR